MHPSSPPPHPPVKMTLEEIAARLRRADIPNARLEARWLLGDAPDEATLAEWVRRREAGEPLQYVEGFAFFMLSVPVSLLLSRGPLRSVLI